MMGSPLRRNFADRDSSIPPLPQARHGLGGIREQIQAAMDAGIINAQPIAPLSQLVLALVDEAALYVGVARQPKRARDEAAGALCHLLDGLRIRAAERERAGTGGSASEQLPTAAERKASGKAGKGR